MLALIVIICLCTHIHSFKSINNWSACAFKSRKFLNNANTPASRFDDHHHQMTPSFRAQSVILRAKGKNNAGGGGLLPRSSLEKTLKYHGMDADKASSVLTIAERSLVEWQTTFSTFLSPAEMNAIEQAFSDVVDVKVQSVGGYSQAERRIAAFSRREEWEGADDDGREGEDQELPKEDLDTVIALVHIEGNFLLDKATDTDFRDSLLALPYLEAEMLGDIVVLGERGCQVLVTSQAAEDVIALKQVRSVPTSCSRIDLEDLKVRPRSVKDLTCVESSTRLDAIGSAGLGISRSRMVKAIEAGQVTVNFKVVKNSSISLKAGDVVMAKSVGRLDLLDVGETRKGKVRAHVRKTV